MAKRTGPGAPIETDLEPLPHLLDRLGPELVPALRRLLAHLPAARLEVLADWYRQIRTVPETVLMKMGHDAITPQNPDVFWTAILDRLAEGKGLEGQSTGNVHKHPRQIPAPPGQTASIPDDHTEPPPARTSSPISPEATADAVESIHVQNGGMVLAAPFLPRLFDQLHLLEEKTFKNRAAAERAVHLLEYMVNERRESPEFQLVLNKILCGLSGSMPIAGSIDLSQREIEAVQGMLESMIGHWKIIGNTSVAGLRSSFLQRPGNLTLRNDAWHLQVEHRSFDMLLDQLPWSIVVIKHPWMKRVLHVSWR